MIAVIPARKGSRSIPGKNHRVLAGRPLVAWVIDAALKSRRIDRTIVATDDPIVAEIAHTMGVDIHHRSPPTATDTAPTEAVLLEVAEQVSQEEDYVLMQPTSPLTTAYDVDRAVELYSTGRYDSLLSVAPQTRFVWKSANGQAEPWNYDPRDRPRRQDCPPLLIENGALYVFSAALLRREYSRLGGRIGLLEMAPETYHELDEPEDWELVKNLLIGRAVEDHRWADIKLVLTDVDGVLTDNGMYWSSDGSELKNFSARDGKGFQLLHEHGIKTAMITSENSDLVARRGKKLGCHKIELNCQDKALAADRIRAELGLDWQDIAFIGDDVHDLGLLELVGVSLSPSDAITSVRAAVDYTLENAGGRGCFRELADLLLTCRRPLNDR